MQDAPARNLPRRVGALLSGLLALAAAGGTHSWAQSPTRYARTSAGATAGLAGEFGRPDISAAAERTFAFPQLRPFGDPQFAEESPDDFQLSTRAYLSPPPAASGSALGTVAPLRGGNHRATSDARSDSRYSVLPTPPGENLGTVGGSGERPDTAAGRQEPYRPDMPPQKRKISTYFADGLTWRSNDNYFQLTFHNLTQFDLRVFQPTGDPLVDSFVLPRQRWYFTGHVSNYVRYYTVINRDYGPLDVLDAFADFSLAGNATNERDADREALEVRVGRMKTPYTYEYVKMAENDLIAPERSVFVANLSGDRQLGAMAHGRLLEQRLEYAVGVFNGQRNSFQDFNNGKDLYTFFNSTPFLLTGMEALRQLNLGGSFNFGREHNSLSPNALRTANQVNSSTAVGSVSPGFLTFNPGDIENGPRMQWSADVAYYYRSLGILSGYQGGFQDYSTSAATPLRTRVPMSGYQVTLFYFLTGEEISPRLLEPRRPLGRVDGVRGENPTRRIGAIELFSRFANLHMGADVLTSGLATSTSANNANVTDVGVNWYLNAYVKLTLDWQYGAYNRPVALTTTGTTSFNNLFWFRSQIYF